jgi:hypothetical protein
MLKKYLFKGALFCAFFALLVSGRVFYLQRSHFMNAEEYFMKAEWKLAIREYDNTMHFYTPWSPYIQKSAKKLWQIGEMFEKQDRLEWARLAYATIRSSFYASRGLYTPGKDWILKCDDKIADLNVKLLIRDGSIKPVEADAEKQKQLYVLKIDRAPNPLWAVLAEAGLWGWIVSVIFIIVKGMDFHGKPVRRFALYGFLSFVLTFALWIVAMIKA